MSEELRPVREVAHEGGKFSPILVTLPAFHGHRRLATQKGREG